MPIMNVPLRNPEGSPYRYGVMLAWHQLGEEDVLVQAAPFCTYDYALGYLQSSIKDFTARGNTIVFAGVFGLHGDRGEYPVPITTVPGTAAV